MNYLQQQKFYQAWKLSCIRFTVYIYNSRNSIKLGNLALDLTDARSTTVEILSSLETCCARFILTKSTTVEILSSLETFHPLSSQYYLQQQKFYQAWKQIKSRITGNIYNSRNSIKLGNTEGQAGDHRIYNSRNSIKLGNTEGQAGDHRIYNSRNSIKLGNSSRKDPCCTSTTVEILSSLETKKYTVRHTVSTTVEILSSLETSEKTVCV